MAMIRNDNGRTGGFRGPWCLGAILVAAAGLSACGAEGAPSYSVADIVDEAPSGILGGASWSMQGAVVRGNEETLRVNLFPMEVDDCRSGAARPKRLRFDVPRLEGEYPLDLDFAAVADRQTVTFVTAPGRNVVATEGLIVIEALDDDTVTLGFVADADNRNYINGRLTARLCHDHDHDG